MSYEEITGGLQAMRKFYDSGAARSYDFRIQQLKKLKAAILKYEKSFFNTLYSDLKKALKNHMLLKSG